MGSQPDGTYVCSPVSYTHLTVATGDFGPYACAVAAIAAAAVIVVFSRKRKEA